MELKELLYEIVANDELHSKWLNTLSLMENTGAKKISACAHKTDVTLIMLKHAAEEHRHAYYLKKQIAKLGEGLCPTYANEFLTAPLTSRNYLSQLDLAVCRYLKKELRLIGSELKYAAYLLVTYAIEVRADGLYPIYQEALEKANSKVNVKSIILEEEGHLEEMIEALKKFSSDWQDYAKTALDIERNLFCEWLKALSVIEEVNIRV